MNSDLRKAMIANGCDPNTGRPEILPKGGKKLFSFVFYVMIDNVPFLVVPPESSPIIKHESSTTMPADAALDALVTRDLVRPGTNKPTVVPVFFDRTCIFFIEIVQSVLVAQGTTFFSTKKYSLINPRTGMSRGGKYVTIGVEEYSAICAKLDRLVPTSLADFAHSGSGGGAVAGGDSSVVTSPHSAPTCRHALCNQLHDEGAGHGGIVIPYLEYHCNDGSKKSAVIMVYEKRSWNFVCEKMENKDNGCWIATIERALREEGKIFLSRHLEEADIKLVCPIGRTPVFYVQLDRSMVTPDLSRGVLNAQVAADNSDPFLPSCFKEIKAIGFFERIGRNLVPLSGNPSGYPNTFSPVVNSWLSS